MKKLAILLVFLFASISSGAPLTLNQIGESSCRVNAGSAYGSGTAVHQDDIYIYVLTNAHVVGRSKNIKLEFFRFGRKTNPFDAEVIWTAFENRTDVDFAIARVKKELFGEYLPRIIPLAPSGHKIKKNDYIASGGCPEARWLQLWEGYALSDADSRVLFTPPPLGGQSGSGVHSIIDNKTYVVAVLTWRIGSGGMDMLGFDNAQGGAIPVSTLQKLISGQTLQPYNVPSSWQKISTEQYTKYALGSDGVYYSIINGQVKVPPGVKIVEWDIILPPINKRPPSNDGGNNNGNNGNPFGQLPPNFGEEGDNSNPDIDVEGLNKEIEDLKKKLADCEKNSQDISQKYQELINESNSLKEQLNAKNNEADNLKIQLEEAIKNKADIDAIKAEIEAKNMEIFLLRSDIKIKEERINEIIIKIDSYNKEKAELKNKIDDKDSQILSSLSENEKVKFQRNLGFGFGSIPILAILIFVVWARFGRKKTKKILDRVEEKVPNRDSDVGDLVKKRLDSLESKILQNESASIEAIQDYVKSLINEKVASHAGSANVGDIVNSLEEKLLQAVDKAVKSNLRKKRKVVNQQVNINSNDFNNVPVSFRVKQFFDLKQKDGEKIEHWALYATLYEEAVTKLRRGELYVSVSGTLNKLQGQQLTADKIDAWVRDEFLKKMTQEKLNSGVLYHRALLGFLYKEAVLLLRNGHFQVLGAEETANAIEQWVKKEFLSRMGVKI